MNRKALGERLERALAMAGMKVPDLARASGMSVSGLRKWGTDGADPSLSNFLAASEALGVSVEWLATGRGDMRSGLGMSQSQSQQMALEQDGALIGMVADAIKRLYEEESARISTNALVQLAFEKYQEIMASAEEPEARRGMIALVVTQLRKELRQAPSAEMTGKRSA